MTRIEAGSQRASRTAERWHAAAVTGAASGIGRAVALALADAGLGVACIDLDRNGCDQTADAIRTNGGQATCHRLDITDAEAVATACREAHARFGRIDILVNCAGISERHAATDFPASSWDRIVDVNLKGTFLCCQAFGRAMIERGEGGRIVNLSSIGGSVAYERTVAYLASKGGVEQLTRGLAVEWARHGITVNAVAPGLVRTPLMEVMAREDPSRVEAFMSRMPLASLVEPDEVAAAVLYLCSVPARMVTGHVLALDGGYVAA